MMSDLTITGDADNGVLLPASTSFAPVLEVCVNACLCVRPLPSPFLFQNINKKNSTMQ